MFFLPRPAASMCIERQEEMCEKKREMCLFNLSIQLSTSPCLCEQPCFGGALLVILVLRVALFIFSSFFCNARGFRFLSYTKAPTGILECIFCLIRQYSIWHHLVGSAVSALLFLEMLSWGLFYLDCFIRSARWEGNPKPKFWNPLRNHSVDCRGTDWGCRGRTQQPMKMS